MPATYLQAERMPIEMNATCLARRALRAEHLTLFEGRHTDHAEPVVVYVSLSYGTVWVRPLSEWNQLVGWPDGTLQPRFVRRDLDDPHA